MKKMLFGLIATVMFSVSGNANNVSNESLVKKEITNYVLDGKSYSPIEFSKLSSETKEVAKACEITVTRTVTINGVSQTFTHTETVEMSWWGCLLAKVGAFLASVL
jgi:hypothetical protein